MVKMNAKNNPQTSSQSNSTGDGQTPAEQPDNVAAAKIVAQSDASGQKTGPDAEDGAENTQENSGDTPDAGADDSQEISAGKREEPGEDSAQDPAAGSELPAAKPSRENSPEPAAGQDSQLPVQKKNDAVAAMAGKAEEEPPEEFQDVGKPADQAAGNKTAAPAKGGDTANAEPEKRTARNSFPWKTSLALVVLFLLAGVTVFFYFHIFKPALNKKPLAADSKSTNSVAAKKQPQPPEAAHRPPDPYQAYKDKLRQATALRQALLAKRREIEKLAHQYRVGILQSEKQILQQLAAEKITSFQQAIKNKIIELALLTIQRRQGYIQMLAQPARWIEQGCERLLYLKRTTEIDLDMMPLASGIDMERHMRYLDAAIQKYRLSSENLTFGMDQARLEPLETIWQQLLDKKKKSPHLQAKITNRIISQEICGGNLQNVSALTEITDEAARCLAKIRKPDLFLNGVATLSRPAALNLLQWKGDWICLNGVGRLSPDVAKLLFHWSGSWISLNGLADFPPELSQYLRRWQGRQLELMGLKYRSDHPERIGLRDLAAWERTGGRLFVPEEIRMQLDQMIAHPGRIKHALITKQ